jgi:ABC-2 type transport system permease protein
MNKIWIIIRREYLNIVRKRTFLLGTFLVPLGMALYFGIIILSAKLVEKEYYTVLYQGDQVPAIASQLHDTETVVFESRNQPNDTLQAEVRKDESKMYLTFPPLETIEQRSNLTVRLLYGGKNPSKPVVREVERQVEAAIQQVKRNVVGITPEQITQSAFELDFQKKELTEEGVSSSNEDIGMFIGMGIFFLVYLLISIYGSILMQGVIEEKSNRIVEIIVSSVRPFELLLGKVLAIGSAGITQFLMWMVLSLGVIFGMTLLSGPIDPNSVSQPGVDVEQSMGQMENILYQIQIFDWSILWFVPIYFLGGFFLFGSLMAAAASAVDNIQDAQQFMTPINILLILPVLFFSNLIQNPNGVFATVISIFPFSSPVSMLLRLSLTEVPWYEVVASIALLILTFLGCIWIAGRIYRVGILMYGKKPSFKELFRWIGHRS